MRIEGVATNGVHTEEVSSIWVYAPEDPLVVEVDFLRYSTWSFSLDLLQEAFTSSSEGLHGSGDVMVEVSEGHAFLHLSNGVDSCTLRFPASEIRDFLNQVDDSGTEEIVSRELEEFLEAL